MLIFVIYFSFSCSRYLLDCRADLYQIFQEYGNWSATKKELSYRKQIARQLRTQFVEGISVTLRSTLRVTQGHWKRNHWTDHTRLTISRKWYHLKKKLEYGFLFAFHSNYGRIFSHFGDIQRQRMIWPWNLGLESFEVIENGAVW